MVEIPNGISQSDFLQCAQDLSILLLTAIGVLSGVGASLSKPTVQEFQILSDFNPPMLCVKKQLPAIAYENAAARHELCSLTHLSSGLWPPPGLVAKKSIFQSRPAASVLQFFKSSNPQQPHFLLKISATTAEVKAPITRPMSTLWTM